jgi:hypothetical protein
MLRDLSVRSFRCCCRRAGSQRVQPLLSDHSFSACIIRRRYQGVTDNLVNRITSARGAALIDDHISHEQATAIVVAARHYRDSMRQYLTERAGALHERTTVDDLVTCIWLSFREAMRAEEELFTLLDALDAELSLSLS